MRTAKFNHVAVGELSANFLEMPAKVSAKAAFVDTKTGQTHGSTVCTHWSEATTQKLRELREAMERDLARLHFADAGEGGAVETTTGSGAIRETFKGLGEHLGAADSGVPQT